VFHGTLYCTYTVTTVAFYPKYIDLKDGLAALVKFYIVD
jgi:hypothetical protein